MPESKEVVDPVPGGTRLSRKNILALVLTITGVILVLFFSSRQSNTPAPLDSVPVVPDYGPFAPINIDDAVPDADPPVATSGWPEVSTSAPPQNQVRHDLQSARYDEARRARPLVHSTGVNLDPEPEPQPIAALGPLVRAGTLIEAALETALNSDRPGPVLARVTQPVRSDEGTLIPSGTRLMGEMAAGNGESIVVAWSRMAFPDGRIQELPGWGALDLSGEHGLRDRVDHHRLSNFGHAALLTLLGGSATVASTAAGLNGTLLALELSRSARASVQPGMRRTPTIKVPTGYRFLIYISDDIYFETTDS